MLPSMPVAATDAGGFDLYLPEAGPSPPVAILVHGGPMRQMPVVAPRQWPVFRGYAAALVARGIAAAMFDHDLLHSLDYVNAASQLATVVEGARAHPGVDADRVALWFFSGGGPLAAGILRHPQPWLRAVALSYPMLQPIAPVDGFSPARELAAAGRLPILFTRAGREFADLVAAQDDFVAAAHAQGAALTVIEVPDAHHAFDVADDTDESRCAIEQALDFLQARLA